MEVQWFGRWEAPRPVRPVSAPASNSILMAETTEELRKRPEIRKELERATGEERPEKIETHGRDRFWFFIYVVVLAVCAADHGGADCRACDFVLCNWPDRRCFHPFYPQAHRATGCCAGRSGYCYLDCF